MAKTPVPMTYDINANQLLVIKVPTKDVATGVLEYQTCFVWRDAEYKAATLQCPSASVDFATQATNDVEGFN